VSVGPRASLLVLVLLGGAGCGGPQPAAEQRPGATSAEAEAEEVPEPPAGSVTSFDVEAAAAQLVADIRARRKELGAAPVLGDGVFRNDTSSAQVDPELVQALVLKALLDEGIGARAWDGLVPEADLRALEQQRRATVILSTAISSERTTSDDGKKVETSYHFQLVGVADRHVIVTSRTSKLRADDARRTRQPPGQPGPVDLGPAVAACARMVAAAKASAVDVLPAEDRTRRRFPDLGPALVGELGAAGVTAQVVARDGGDEELSRERDHEEDPGADVDGPRATHTLATRLFEESWSGADGEPYRSVIAVFFLVDATSEVAAMSVVRVRG